MHHVYHIYMMCMHTYIYIYLHQMGIKGVAEKLASISCADTFVFPDVAFAWKRIWGQTWIANS